MDEATLRPWRQISVRDQNDRWTIAQAGVGHALNDPSMFVGGRVRNEADAALIVEAVNAYDRLRAIEVAARAFAEDHPDEQDGCPTAIALRTALSRDTDREDRP